MWETDGVPGSWFKPGLALADADGSPLSPPKALPLRKVKLGPTLRCNGPSHCLQCQHPIPALATSLPIQPATDALGKAEDGPSMWAARMTLPIPALALVAMWGVNQLTENLTPSSRLVNCILSSSHSRAHTHHEDRRHSKQRRRRDLNPVLETRSADHQHLLLFFLSYIKAKKQNLR